MNRKSGRRWLGVAAASLTFSLALSACGSSSGDLLVRSDPGMQGMVVGTEYDINSSPDGGSEKNVSVTQGIGNFSPLVGKVTTTFGKGRFVILG